MCDERFDCNPAQNENNNINDTVESPAVIGAIESDKNVVSPIALFVIAAPSASVAEAIIILGHETPFTIASLILINGLPS